ncbi:ectoine synthase [Desulfurispira natronophila]|uniref:L-ectoine synthase n=1 Tax=Desulfurispira natronophila TaxID=682562 RepID=A0A7W7Y3C9_9BACT|nr:ectoine synthase [Desulfurispira natronophila]MBB5021313.1 L-ectoine synthase [Desulfurispira natronophila]
MIVKSLDEIKGTEREVRAENGQWVSYRLLLKDEGMGFSFHVTTIFAGNDNFFQYKNHLESVYCVAGEGEIEDLETGIVYPIKPGTVYALDQHDRHRLRAFKDMTMACTFNPPVSGREVHDADGSYPADLS